MKKLFFSQLLSIITMLFFSMPMQAQENIEQTLSITTDFKNIVGNPIWLLEIRDVESGEILPYIFDVTHKSNFWVAYSKERSYRIKASVLKFGSYATVNNFCYLEDGILTGKSMYITLTGTLAPGLKRTKCHVIKFNQGKFAIATPTT